MEKDQEASDLNKENQNMSADSFQESEEQLPSEQLKKLEALRKEIHKILIGQDELIDFLLIGLLSEGHVLLEGVPGVAKTLIAKILAKTLSLPYGRIQFTPDLMPTDITGTNIYNDSTNKFEFVKGPIFNQLILIDEVNRAPAKTQAAMFECMAERQVSVDGMTYQLDEPFLVLATQNPIDSEGTYKLPEAQLDRFLFKLEVNYPNQEEELAILKAANQNFHFNRLDSINSVLSKSDLLNFRNEVSAIQVDEKLLSYMVKVIHQSREDPQLSVGGSPRAALGILQATKALAFIKGRKFVIPEDVKEVVPAVLRHRLILTPEKEIEGLLIDEVIDGIIEQIEVPR
ncbi:MAG: MoxR family ATPase [Vicingaceae bacterium]